MASALSKILRRPPGKGWIILSGGNLADDQVQQSLALVDIAGNALSLATPDSDWGSVENSLVPWLENSGWSGKVLRIDPDSSLEDEIGEASLILLPDSGTAEDYVRAIGQSDLGEQILVALDDGAVVIADGVAADALGEVVVDRNTPTSAGTPGLGWIPSSIVQSHFSAEEATPILRKRGSLFRLGLPAKCVIALGPDEEREIWGEVRPTITFGSGWAS